MIFKVKCNQCGQEHIIFDNRKHGYNAFAEENKKEYTYEDIYFSKKKFKESSNNTVKVRIKKFSEESIERFIEHIREKVTEDVYANAFLNITIYGFIQDLSDKKVTIYSGETA